MSRALSVVVLVVVGAAVLLLALGPEPDATPPPVTTAHRIVSLGPSFTEIVLFLGAGDRLVGVTNFCENVPEGIARIGKLHTPDLEAIVGLEPDCVLGVASKAQSSLFDTLRKLGLSVEILAGDSVADIRTAVLRIGEWVDSEQRASALVAELDRRLVAAPDRASAPTVAFVIHHAPLFVAGRGSFVDGMLEAAGWRNAFADSDAKWVQVEAEEMVQRRPDAIVDTTLESRGGAIRRVWGPFGPHLEAVRAERVFSFPAVRPGVRIPEWIDRLIEIRVSLSRPEEATPPTGGKLKPG